MKHRHIHEKVSNLLFVCYRVSFYLYECGKEFNKMDTALVIIDVQYDYFSHGKVSFSSETSTNSNKKIAGTF